MPVTLQCALDMPDLEFAVSIAREVVKSGVTWLEVGTPLIKAVGLTAVATMKKKFPQTPIVADLKTLDFGELEVGLAAKSGADVVMISAASSDATVRSAVRCAQKYGLTLVASLMGVESPVRRSREVTSLGINRILVHFSAETEFSTSRSHSFALVRRVCAIPVGIGGGVNETNVARFARLGCNYFVVGRGIVESESPGAAVRAIRSALQQGTVG